MWGLPRRYIIKTALISLMETIATGRYNAQTISNRLHGSDLSTDSLLNTQGQDNRAVIENGEVKLMLSSDEIELEEARHLLHEVVRLEYSLP